MAKKKTGAEPEAVTPDEPAEIDLAKTGGETAADEAGTLSVEDLVPGLAEEIERQEAEAEPTDAEMIVALEAECVELRDKWVRALAEGENVRRRAERDRKDAASYGGTRLARDMLSVHDNLERALKAADDDDLRQTAAPLIEGVELTLRELINAFAKHKIEKVTPEIGEKFDPNRHQAMFEAPIPNAEPGTVIDVMQEGFVIADRLLRPAMVGIAKNVPKPAAVPDPAETSGDGEG